MAVAILGLLYIGYLAVIDGTYVRRPVVIEDPLHLQTTKSEYRVGEMMAINISFCKNRTITSEYQWQLVDGILIFFPKGTSTLLPGCHSVVMDVAPVPNLIQGEEAHLEGLVTYRVNPLKTVEVELKTNTFKIIK